MEVFRALTIALNKYYDGFHCGKQKIYVTNLKSFAQAAVKRLSVSKDKQIMNTTRHSSYK